MIKGIFGGTFDPIHCGHLSVVEHLSNHLKLDAIHFIPCLTPPHRHIPEASPEHRLAMVQLAIANHPNWIADDIDFKRRGPSYMVDTLNLLREREPEVSWCLIVGMDAFAKLNEWHNWKNLLNLAHLIIVNRPNFELPTANWSQELLAKHGVQSAEYFNRHQTGGILLFHIPPSPISGTAIRYQLKRKKKNLWLPDSVFNYIEKNKLYT